MTETTYGVAGMTCENCVRLITKQVTRIDGVTAVQVDLGGGRVTVLGEGYADQAVRAAINGAGYRVTDEA